MKKDQGKLTLRHKIGYGCGDDGGLLTLVMVGVYLTRYITNILQIPYATLSIMLLVWNAWDMINDPLMGTIMDKFFARHHKHDKFRPWILASIPMIVIGFIAFFSVPSMFGGMGTLIALFLLKIVYEFGYTMMNIGMGSLLGVMANDDHERATLASARGLGSTLGGLVASMSIPQILKYFGETTKGYAISAVFTGLLGGLLIFLNYAWTEERNHSARNKKNDPADKIQLVDVLNVFRKNRAFLALCLHSIVITFAVSLYGQSSSYMYADVIGDIGLMSFSSLLSTVLTVIFLFLSPTLANKFGLVETIRVCLLIGIGGMIALFVTLEITLIPAIAYLFWAGISFALINLSVQMQWGLVGESIDYNEYQTGKRTEGSIYGMFSLTRRLGTLISNSLIVLMFGWIGYDQAAAAAGTAQTASTVSGLKIMALLIPAVFAVLSWVSFRFVWNIDDDLRAKIAARKKEKELAVEAEEAAEAAAQA